MNAAKSFQADFYITCATVIPVLYLALILQGPYEYVLKQAVRMATLRTLVVAYLVTAGGLVGEAIALLVLFMGSDTKTIRVIVLIATLGTLGAVGAGPTISGWQSIRKVGQE